MSDNLEETGAPVHDEGSVAFSVVSRATSKAPIGRVGPLKAVVPEAATAFEPGTAVEAEIGNDSSIETLSGVPELPDLPKQLEVPEGPVSGYAESVADLAAMKETPVPSIARTGFRGMLGRLGIPMPPSVPEQVQRAEIDQLRRDEEIIRQATWTRAVSILVANPKGGVGKTPVSLLLGGTLAAVRGGSVCIVEVSDDPGALGFRAEGQPQLGLGELVRDIRTVASAGQLAGYTAPQTSFASVIGSIGPRDRLTRADVAAVSAVIDAYYGVRVMDSGNQTSSEAFAGALETADALVIPVLNAGDAVLEAVSLLDRLRSEGGASADLAERAIILRLTDGRPEHPQVTERIERIIAGANVAHVFDVPYDAHIGERGQLTLASLDPASYRVFAAAAAAIVRSLQQVGRS